MAMVKMTLEQGMEELKKPSILKIIREGMKRKPDTSDPDAPDLADLLAQGQVRRVGRPAKANPKKLVAIRVDADVYAAAKKYPGYSTRVNDMMRGMFVAAGVL